MLQNYNIAGFVDSLLTHIPYTFVEGMSGRRTLEHERLNVLSDHKEYSSFMLRFRRMQADDQATWVVSLQGLQTGQMQCFPGLEGLIAFLLSEFGPETVEQPAGSGIATALQPPGNEP